MTVYNCHNLLQSDTLRLCLFLHNSIKKILFFFLKDELFTALLEALADCKNFKVRISAAVALTSLSDRSKYGNVDIFVKVWVETLKALEKSEELTDFTEFKHKENLQEQVMNCKSSLQISRLLWNRFRSVTFYFYWKKRQT